MTEFSRLQELVELAKEPSSEKRRKLLRGVTDIFLDEPDQFEAKEKSHLDHIMTQVAGEMERKVRAELAHRLADIPNAPVNLLVDLANDDIEVARPVLERSTALGDDHLSAIVSKHKTSHLAAIAGRQDVSEDLSDALVESGDEAALSTLVQNTGAQINRVTMSKVVEKAEQVEALHAPLLNRTDMPADLMHDMFWYVSSQLRERILSKAQDLDPAVVDELLAASEANVVTSVQVEKPRLSQAQRFINRKVENRELNEALLVQLIRENLLPELVCAFARLTELDERTAKRILFDKSGEGLAVACKASRFDRATFSTLVLLGSTDKSRSMDTTYHLLALYDQVPTDVAQRTMRFWRIRRQTMDKAAELQSPAAPMPLRVG